MDNSSSGTFAILGIIYVIVLIGIIAFSIFVWWRIFSKAGYSGALGILIFIPIANLIVILMLAFAEWPILKELNMLRQQRGMMPPGYPQAPQGSYAPNPQYPPAPQYPSGPQYPPSNPQQPYM